MTGFSIKNQVAVVAGRDCFLADFFHGQLTSTSGQKSINLGWLHDYGDVEAGVSSSLRKLG